MEYANIMSLNLPTTAVHYYRETIKSKHKELPVTLPNTIATHSNHIRNSFTSK